MSQKTIIINGVEYDSQSGLPVDKTVTATTTAPTKAVFTPHTPVRPSQSVHQTTEKSQTLNRQTVKKSTPKPAASVVAQATPAVSAQPAKKSPAITKFAPHPATINKAPRMMDIAPATNRMNPANKRTLAPKKVSPVAIRTQPVATPTKPAVSAPVTMKAVHTTPAAQQPTTPAAPKPSQIIKQEAIDKALATPTKREGKRRKIAKSHAKKTRTLSIASASLALLMLGGYFTYLNMPSLSVRVAAAQSGVNASYPGYKPDGYSINGLVTYNKDTVTMKFASNGGPQSYTIDQTKKNWDSSAVLENYVKPKVGGSYIPYSERGLTIYTFENNAAWVNNGTFYTISGDAPLSSDQILHIASSM